MLPRTRRHAIAAHIYKLGQHVSLRQTFPNRAAVGDVEVVRLMPESVDGEMHYRVRGPDKIERAVRESQLSGSRPE